MSAARLVSTGVAARDLGVDTRTLQRWAALDLVAPALTTAGGHHRWDVDDLHRQLAQHRDQLDSAEWLSPPQPGPQSKH